MGVQMSGLTDEQRQKFDQYLSLLIKWNKTHNLTAIRDPDDMVKRHFLECIALIPHLGPAETLLDLGTGAGFPGLPLAIMCPHLHVTGLDSAHKKIAFCQEVIRVCDLSQATAILADADDPATASKMGRFDVIVSRATWSLADYLPIAFRYVRTMNTAKGGRAEPPGVVLAMKGPRYQEELKVTPPLPTHICGPEVRPLSTVGEVLQNLVVIKYRTQ